MLSCWIAEKLSQCLLISAALFDKILLPGFGQWVIITALFSLHISLDAA
jgi:hypothetical protein